MACAVSPDFPQRAIIEPKQIVSAISVEKELRLSELELQKIYQELESEDEETRNNAGEIVFQTESLSQKLKLMYEEKILTTLFILSMKTIYKLLEKVNKALQRTSR